MSERERVARRVGQAAAVQAQFVGADADAVAVGLSGLDDVVENQCRAAGARHIVRQHRATADIEFNFRTTGHYRGFADSRGNHHHITRLERTGFRAGDGKACHCWRQHIHGLYRLGGLNVAAQPRVNRDRRRDIHRHIAGKAGRRGDHQRIAVGAVRSEAALGAIGHRDVSCIETSDVLIESEGVKNVATADVVNAGLIVSDGHG